MIRLTTILFLLVGLALSAQTGVTLTSGGTSITLRNGGNVFAITAVENFVRISSFTDFKADLLNLTNVSIIGGNTVTAGSYAFVAGDVNKIVVVKNARNYPAYRRTPFTLTARIIAVGSGNATITILDSDGTIRNTTGQTGWVATDNFDVVQKAIDSCVARGKPRLYMDYIGTAYLVPALSLRAMPLATTSTLVVSNSLEVYGVDSASTKMKWGMEDIQRVGGTSSHKFYDGFWVNSCTFKLNKITLLSADRISTRNDHADCYAIYGNNASRNNQNIIIDSASIRGNGYTSTTDTSIGTTIQGWGNAVYMNSSLPSAATDTCKMDVRNSYIEAQGGLSYFSHSFADGGGNYQDTLNRLMRVWNSDIRSGAAYERKYKSVTITAGAGRDTIKIIDDNFSFYDFNDYEVGGTDVRRLPVMAILRSAWVSRTVGQGADSVYWTKVKTVLTDSTALMVTALDDNGLGCVTGTSGGGCIAYQNTPWNSTAASSVYLVRSYNRNAAFHSTYVSGSLGRDIKTVTIRALRFGGNAQNVCDIPLSTCGSCLKAQSGVTGVLTFSEIGRQVKHIIIGNTSGDYMENLPGTFLFSAPQKYFP